MRDILFRAKRKDNGEWVYGDIIHRRYIKKDVVVIRTEDSGFDNYSDYEVDPSTAGQYTGLKDKNGKRIFEGDIVDYNRSLHKVVFEIRNSNARFGIVIDELETWDFSAATPPDMMIVVGNIHDNPELLEVGE